MFKKMLSAFSVGALALSLLFVKEAKADQVTEGRPAPEDTTDQGTSTQAVSAVNKVEVDAAKDSLDQKNEQVKEGEAAVKKAEKSVETAKANAELAKEAVKTAEEGTQASSVTKEAAREAVTNQTEAVKEAEKVAQASQTELDKSQNQANSQAQKTQEAKEALKKEDEKVNQAQADLEQAQKTQAGSSAEVSANLEQAKVDVANSQVAVNKAQEEVNKAEQSDSQRQEKIDQAVSNKAQADSDAEKSKQALDKASSQEAEAQAKLSQAQASLEAAQASLKPSVSNNKNRLYMTPEYIAALKQLADPNTPQSQISQIEATLTAVNDKAKSYNNYIADPNDSTKMYDTNNIPYEVRRELSQFASELINQLRAQMGTGENLLTPSSLEFADKVSQAYRNDNWNWDLMNRYHHDTWGINRVAREYGLVTTTSEQEQQGLQYYENAYIWRANTAQMSVADMKRDIYFSLVEFMYNGYEWVHAKSISGLNTGSQKNYLGVDFSMESDITVAHFTMVSEDQVKYATKNNFDATPLTASGNSTPSDPQALAQAQAAYDQAKSAHDQAQAEKTAAQDAYDQAVTAVQAAQKQLDEAKQAPMELATAQAALASAKQELEKNQEKLSRAQEALNLASSDQADKAAALSKAQETLSAAQAAQAVARDRLAQEENALAQANQALEQARSKREAAQAAAAQAQTALDQAQKNLANLQDAQTNLEQAQANLAAAEKDLADKTSDLAAKQQTLSELKAAQAQAEKVYNSLAAQLQAQEKQKRDDHYRNILDQTEKRLNGPVQSNPSEEMQTQESGSDPLVKTKEEPIVKGVATRKADASIGLAMSSDPSENHSMQDSVGSAKLPNTGSRLSVWAMMSGILALVSGFALLVWKHKKESKN
ncbi:SEC10/PgrA surface exclusion domain-containing protein [Streptococcus gordonii]|uniref:SEC10/PgrA surface exclusion domain-containing protein n=2 Tax=Streptococcus gordonii TaxID=1302 RepID=UPI001EDD7CF4|nr:SEC10/PgrA surface exclusion domain-containing protein [Streptococcus gordonii]MCG4821874.1 SEC10/PgrA surface exclusion domain-containing protein [Streptococcus gordonii]MCG4847232.1 SEC10/PgrA surface exclusion domain-containing protein [Streptococcus gordonii]MDE8686650.1 SEC10/PgrA surface exclusion domain-containing protein [Streptococcus gordonii]